VGRIRLESATVRHLTALVLEKAFLARKWEFFVEKSLRVGNLTRTSLVKSAQEADFGAFFAQKRLMRMFMRVCRLTALWSEFLAIFDPERRDDGDLHPKPSKNRRNSFPKSPHPKSGENLSEKIARVEGFYSENIA
jgi:hypothetical protein